MSKPDVLDLIDTPADGYGEVFDKPIDPDTVRGFLARASGTVGPVDVAKLSFIPGKSWTLQLWVERAKP